MYEKRLYEVSREVKFIEVGSRRVVRQGEQRLRTCFRVSVLQINVLEVVENVTVNTTEQSTLKWLRWKILCYVYLTTFKISKLFFKKT